MVLEQDSLLGFIQLFCTVALAVLLISVIVRGNSKGLKKSIERNTNLIHELERKINALGRLQESSLDIESSTFIDEIPSTDSQGISPDMKLYVGNIDYSVTEQELRSLFSKFGEIDMVNIPVHRHSGKTRGFGFVTFTRVEQASEALTLNGSDFKGRSLQINYAKSKAS